MTDTTRRQPREILSPNGCTACGDDLLDGICLTCSAEHEHVWLRVLCETNETCTCGATRPRIYDDLRALVIALGRTGWEGIVWHHPDGRMAKLKVRDFPPAPAAHTPTRDGAEGSGA